MNTKILHKFRKLGLQIVQSEQKEHAQDLQKKDRMFKEFNNKFADKDLQSDT